MASGEVECKKTTTSVILYPSLGVGHMVSMVELGKLLLHHGLSVTILVVDSPYNGFRGTAAFVARTSAANPALNFHLIPPINPSTAPEFLDFDLLRRNNSNIRSFLISASPAAVVIDFFCSYALEVTAELRIPCYFFYTSGIHMLATFLYLPKLHSATNKSFRELGKKMVEIPGLSALPADHMPRFLLDRDATYEGLLYHSTNLVKSDGVLINSFDALQPTALEAISNGRCVADGQQTPPVHCVGPLDKSNRSPEGYKDECVAWLNAQPRASVVFLCFGSLGVFSDDQVYEIAAGLELSQHRFLWVVQSPPRSGPWQREPELEQLLPSGFLDRTKARGLTVKSWVPQAEVLNHKSVGGFVTHCGWNSILEAVVAGVPMVAWPLYAEQRMNKTYLVEEMKLAVAVEGYDEEMVAAEEVEAKVRWLMESEGGIELRERATCMKQRAAEALRVGGSSNAAWMKLVSLLSKRC